MSGVTLAQLLAGDPAPFTAAATAWRTLATGLDDAAEELIRGSAGLAAAWDSDAGAPAAVARTAEVRAELSNCYNPALRISQALDDHAYAMADLRDQARAVIDRAGQAGLTVDTAAGTVTARMPADAADAERLTVAVTEVANDLKVLLQRARTLDADTANAIGVNLPAPGTGFGNLSLPAVSRETVQAQRFRDPKLVNAWWSSLTPEQQEQLLCDDPDVVGWLDGVPAADRDYANRIMLERFKVETAQRKQELEALAAEQTSQTIGSWDNGPLSDTIAELTAIGVRERALSGVELKLSQLGERGYLLGLDIGGDGNAIISVGNPDTARHTSVSVHGLGADLGGIGGDLDRIMCLQQAADALTPAPGDVASILWLGYDTPDTYASAISPNQALAAAAPLRSFLDGLHATHAGGDYHVTAVGHSYGSSVIAATAVTGSLPADDLVAAGSPGLLVGSTGDLNLPPHHVWVGQAVDDPIGNPSEHAWLTSILSPSMPQVENAILGTNPGDPAFGANDFHVDTSGHAGYWTPDSESLLNQARVVVGQYSTVGLDHGQAPPDLPR